MFLHVSVILFTGGGVGWRHALQQVWGVVSQHYLQVSRPTSRGKLRSLARGVSRPTPGGISRSTPRESPGPHLGGLQAHIQGSPGPHPEVCVSACTEADPPRQRLLWAVRILLECILVFMFVSSVTEHLLIFV